MHSLALGYDLAHVSTVSPAFTIVASILQCGIELGAVVLIMGKHSRGYYRHSPARS